MVTEAIAISRGSSSAEIRSSSITTDVSSRPLACWVLATRSRALIQDGVHVCLELLGVHGCGVGKHRLDRLPRHQAMPPKRCQFPYGNPVSGDHKRLPGIEGAHDTATIV